MGLPEQPRPEPVRLTVGSVPPLFVVTDSEGTVTSIELAGAPSPDTFRRLAAAWPHLVQAIEELTRRA